MHVVQAGHQGAAAAVDHHFIGRRGLKPPARPTRWRCDCGTRRPETSTAQLLGVRVIHAHVADTDGTVEAMREPLLQVLPSE